MKIPDPSTKPTANYVTKRTTVQSSLFLAGLMTLTSACANSDVEETLAAVPYATELSLQARAIDVRYESSMDSVVFEMRVEGDAGDIRPTPAGQVDGAPVLGYVFLTNLESTDVGFDKVDGTVALAITSHPDFDDTPLWDEDGNDAYDDDGIVYHAHWVVLIEDSRAPAGLAVRQRAGASVLPPTAPMDMYLDSPGFTVVEDGGMIRAVVPGDRIARRFDMAVGGLTAYMEVDASGSAPLLAVHGVISQVEEGAMTTLISGAADAPATNWPERSTQISMGLDPSFDVVGADARYSSATDSFILSMNVGGTIGVIEPVPTGQVDGAGVLGYVFPTTIPPSAVGFQGIMGTTALAVTSHPDFDDTPLWDETRDADYGNDGGRYHVHWVVLVDDPQSGAGLSVPSQTDPKLLPPTAPMPMYLDSPGYHAFARGGTLHVVVPGWHLHGVDAFSYDALTARMVVDASLSAPVLRVEQVYRILSGDLSLPLTVGRTGE